MASRKTPWLLTLLPVFLLGFVLVGCRTATVTDATKASPELATLSEDRKPELDSQARTSLGLMRDGKTLHVGDDSDVALDLFPKSLAAGGYDIHDLPRAFPSPPYSSRGWDSPSGDGFGEIIYNKQVAAAIWNRVLPNEAAADTVVADYKNDIPSPAAPAFGYNGLTYTFWEAKPQQRLMILKRPLSQGRWGLTIALGDDVVLDALGINKEGAWHDIAVLKRSDQAKSGDKGKGS